jgi:uncharacterized protein (DUF952 family)
MERLFHIIDPAVWGAVVEDYRPASLAEQGYVHLSFVDQVDGVANERYSDAGALCVLEVDPQCLRDEIKLEDSYGAGVEFPHLYGPLPLAAVITVHDLPRDADGRFTFAAAGRASSGR